MGTDIVSVQRIYRLLKQHGDRFKQKTFTINESSYCDGKPNPSIHFAGRFAAKESIKKCIYSSGYEKEISFNKIEILPDINGIPIVTNINELTYKEIKVSISHESEFAVAMAVLFY
ncbi:MAG: holo-ACP synthase [Fidelibacterota bacterium]